MNRRQAAHKHGRSKTTTGEIAGIDPVSPAQRHSAPVSAGPAVTPINGASHTSLSAPKTLPADRTSPSVRENEVRAHRSSLQVDDVELPPLRVRHIQEKPDREASPPSPSKTDPGCAPENDPAAHGPDSTAVSQSDAVIPVEPPATISLGSPRSDVLDSEAPTAHPGEGTMASFGEELRRQRELRAVSLREISDATKINIRFLEALEGNDFKHLPGGQFNKGFIRAYARHIGISPEEMVESYLLELRGQEEGVGSRRATAARGSARGSSARTLILSAVGVVLIALIAVAVWFFLLRPRAVSTKERPTSSAEPSRAGAPPSSPADIRPSGVQSDRAGEGSGASTPVETASQSPEHQGALPVAPLEGAPPRENLSTGSAETAETPAAGRPSSTPPSATETTDAGREITHPSSPAPTAQETAAQETLILRVIPFQPVRFGLLCGGKEMHSGNLAPGTPMKFECAGTFEVTLDDAGAVSMSVNGERIYLGRPGQSIAGRHVSAQNYLDFVKPPSEGSPR